MTHRQESEAFRHWFNLGWFNCIDDRLYRMDSGASLPLDSYLILPFELHRVN